MGPTSSILKDGKKCNTYSLNELKKGQKAIVRFIQAQGELGRRLRDMGLLPGVELTISGCAPLGDPICVSLDGYALSLRCTEADTVLVEKCSAF